MHLPARTFMRCLGIVAVLILAAPGRSRAADPQTTWYGTYMNGRKIGSMSLTSEPMIENGVEHVRLTTISSVTVTMMGVTVQQESTVVSVCDASLRPLRQEYTIVSGGSTMRLKATYEPRSVTCIVEAGGSPSTKTIPIPKGAVLTADSSFVGVGTTPKVGTRAVFHYLNPLTVALEKATVNVDAVGKATLADATYDAYRVTATTPLGAVTSWQTAGGELLWARLPLGMAMYRMSESAAKASDTPEPQTSESVVQEARQSEDFATATAIVPDRPIPNPRKVRKLTLEIGGIPSDQAPISDYWQTATRTGAAEANDGEARNVYTFTIRAISRPAATATTPAIPSAVRRYVQPAPYLDLDVREIRALAAKLRDPKGRPPVTAARIRAWIHKNMTPDFGIGVPRSALDVLKRRRGVCRDYATLFASLARAAGIPTRVVGGVVYGEGRFYYHAWVECWQGRWVPYDATLPTDFVDATHVKFSQGDPADMMHVTRVIGKLTVKVIAVEP